MPWRQTLRNDEYFIIDTLMNMAFHNSGPREKEETRDRIWMCNFEEKKSRYSRKDNLLVKLTNQRSTPSRFIKISFKKKLFNNN
jgi:hypothetical protein